MKNKLISLMAIICFALMAGFASFFGEILPEGETLGKSITITMFYSYELLCIITAIHFWFKD